MRNMKIILSVLLVHIFIVSVNSQPRKDSLFISDGKALVQELRMMWNYDQAVRKYLDYQTFDANVIANIEMLKSADKARMLDSLRLQGPNIDKVWHNYITPADHLHTKRMIEIIRTYGFPSNERIKRLVGQKLEFNTYAILLHSPKEYFSELKGLIMFENKIGNFPNKCHYGHLLWHLNGRSDFKYFLENGYVWEKRPDGSQTMVAKNCE